MRPSFVRLAPVVAALAGVLALLPSAAQATAFTRKPDFNGDGSADIAIGEPNIWIGGRVRVQLGSTAGLTTTYQRSQRGGVDNIAMGLRTASGDFNGDHFCDLAYSAPNSVSLGVDGQLHDFGAVFVSMGSIVGFSFASGGDGFDIATSFGPDTPVVPDAPGDTPSTVDEFGGALASGDFNHDGYDDLAVGSPTEMVNGMSEAGSLRVFYGSSRGLTGAVGVLWHQDSAGIADACEPFDHFGSSLATGDINHDGYDDLVVGIPNETVTASGEGAVEVLFGSASGITASGSQFLYQGCSFARTTLKLAGTPETNDAFGYTVAVGDFNHDLFADVAIGVSGEDANAGTVQVLAGGTLGVGPAGQLVLEQGIGGVSDAAEQNDHFGMSLATGDTNGDGYDDLAAGAPYEDLGGIADVGLVQVFRGGSTGLTTTGQGFWSEDTRLVAGTGETGDRFGQHLILADCNGDGRADLLVTVPGKAVGGVANTGCMNAIYGSSTGLTTLANAVYNGDAQIGGTDGVHFGDTLFLVSIGNGNAPAKGGAALAAHAVAPAFAMRAGRDGAVEFAWGGPAHGATRCEVFDVRGARIGGTVLPEGAMHAAWTPASANGAPVQRGMYLVRARNGETVQTARILVTR